MATKLKSVDVVLVGFGWTASILAKELADAGLQVLAIERGKFRDTVPDFATTHIQDELKRSGVGYLRTWRAKRLPFVIRSTKRRCQCATLARSTPQPA